MLFDAFLAAKLHATLFRVTATSTPAGGSNASEEGTASVFRVHSTLKKEAVCKAECMEPACQGSLRASSYIRESTCCCLSLLLSSHCWRHMLQGRQTDRLVRRLFRFVSSGLTDSQSEIKHIISEVLQTETHAGTEIRKVSTNCNVGSLD